MVGIHPMTRDGSVREFVGTRWMSFGDYQQNYPDLHGRLLLSRKANLPLVNSEYGYYLRDMNGDGIPDKDNSFNVDDMRHATWDIAMAGSYFVTGFGTTYFGGNRDPGPFDLEAPKNDVWESQIQHVKSLFTSLDWSKLEPHDELIKGPFQREKDGRRQAAKNGGRFKVLSPPERTYWLLADPGKTCVAYVRGGKGPWQVELKAGAEAGWTVRLFDPRLGAWQPLKTQHEGSVLDFKTPDATDWVIVAERK